MIKALVFVVFSACVYAQEEPSPIFNYDKDISLDINSNLGSKFSNWNSSALFNFDGNAETPLGKFKAWFGDLVYPVVVIAFSVIVVYYLVQLALQILGFAVVAKGSAFSGFSEWAVSTPIFQKFFGKFVSIDGSHEATFNGSAARELNTPVADMIVRLLTRTLEGIEAAKEKYED